MNDVRNFILYFLSIQLYFLLKTFLTFSNIYELSILWF